MHHQPLGFDSCGIFYIGGNVQVSVCWSLQHIDVLTAVADAMDQKYADAQCEPLDVYHGQNTPGHHWARYRSTSCRERKDDKNLGARLEDLLRPSSAMAEHGPWRQGSNLCLRQIIFDKKQWLAREGVPPDAHFPLFVFTKNASA